jgi:hypothetical protein
MDSAGALEAKTHLSELLDRVRQGEKITITRHGVQADPPGNRGGNAGAAQADQA